VPCRGRGARYGLRVSNNIEARPIASECGEVFSAAQGKSPNKVLGNLQDEFALYRRWPAVLVSNAVQSFSAHDRNVWLGQQMPAKSSKTGTELGMDVRDAWDAGVTLVQERFSRIWHRQRVPSLDFILHDDRLREGGRAF